MDCVDPLLGHVEIGFKAGARQVYCVRIPTYAHVGMIGDFHDGSNARQIGYPASMNFKSNYDVIVIAKLTQFAQRAADLLLRIFDGNAIR